MRKISLLLLALSLVFATIAQEENLPQDTTWKKKYRETFEITNDLVHTKLDIRFDYPKAYAYGKVWLTLKPHFYATNNLKLDAKGMDIHKVSIVKGTALQPLKFDYDGYVLNISLDKTYKGGEKYTVFIDYTSKPNEFKVQGSAAITDAKGLYYYQSNR